jgi:hypothetical protein
MTPVASRLRGALVAALVVTATASPVQAQHATPRTPTTTDTVTVAAGAHYQAGALHRFFLGGAYRDLWTAPIRVPVLNLQTYAGGLRPLKEGGGVQTRSLRFVTPDRTEYVFRSVDKFGVAVPPMWKGSIVDHIGHDMISNSNPASAQVAAPILDAAGVLHVTPAFVVMPDDPLLGKYRKKYAGLLGTIEEYPTTPKDDVPGFANAKRIIDSDSLLKLIDDDPSNQVDSRAFLRARLVDMLLGDWDRHQGQWKWALLVSRPTDVWEPIPRDRDHALVSSSGLFAWIIRGSQPTMTKFDASYPPVGKLVFNSRQLDRRLLAGVGKATYDSIANALKQAITDSAILVAVHEMPADYQHDDRDLARDLERRRDSLRVIADKFYAELAPVVDIHATDAADHATVRRIDDHTVDVVLADSHGEGYFDRRFDAGETREIRVYLHGGDDTAIVTGAVTSSIPVRVIGGNGSNVIIDSSRVAGDRHSAHLYDVGTVSNVSYGPDTLFSRRPMLRRFGTLISPVPDYGTRFGPAAKMTVNHDYGIMPGLGVAHYSYGFGDYPYSSMYSLIGEYSTHLHRSRVTFTADDHFAQSPLHVTMLGRMSQIEVVEFHGLGNSTPQSATDYFDVHQRQWLLRPAMSLGLARKSDLSFGPVIDYFQTDNVPGHFVSAARPYGFGSTGDFGEAGVQLTLHHDGREFATHPFYGTLFDLGGSYYPAVWDLRTAFEEAHVAVAQYYTLPIPTHPHVVLRGGAKKLWGDFPFQEAAFIGGSSSIRTIDRDRYAGDAAVYGTAELRVPVAHVTVLVPLDLGLLGTIDVGRVYVDGSSPDGWHNALGGGFWIAFHTISADIRIIQANDVGRPAAISVSLGMSIGSRQ